MQIGTASCPLSGDLMLSPFFFQTFLDAVEENVPSLRRNTKEKHAATCQ